LAWSLRARLHHPCWTRSVAHGQPGRAVAAFQPLLPLGAV